MAYMFNACTKLKEIYGINNFNTANVITMEGMFEECNELEYLELSNFNTSNVTNIAGMFNACVKIKEIKGINKFNTTNVITMEGMFQECNELEYLDLSSFEISNVTNMSWMFNSCIKLIEINGIEKFISDNEVERERIFQDCPISNFDIKKGHEQLKY